MVDTNETNRPDFRTLKSKLPPIHEIETFLK